METTIKLSTDLRVEQGHHLSKCSTKSEKQEKLLRRLDAVLHLPKIREYSTRTIKLDMFGSCTVQGMGKWETPFSKEIRHLYELACRSELRQTALLMHHTWPELSNFSTITLEDERKAFEACVYEFLSRTVKDRSKLAMKEVHDLDTLRVSLNQVPTFACWASFLLKDEPDEFETLRWLGDLAIWTDFQTPPSYQEMEPAFVAWVFAGDPVRIGLLLEKFCPSQEEHIQLLLQNFSPIIEENVANAQHNGPKSLICREKADTVGTMILSHLEKTEEKLMDTETPVNGSALWQIKGYAKYFELTATFNKLCQMWPELQ